MARFEGDRILVKVLGQPIAVDSDFGLGIVGVLNHELLCTPSESFALSARCPGRSRNGFRSNADYNTRVCTTLSGNLVIPHPEDHRPENVPVLEEGRLGTGRIGRKSHRNKIGSTENRINIIGSADGRIDRKSDRQKK